MSASNHQVKGMARTLGAWLFVLAASTPVWAGAEAETYSEFLENMYRDTVPVIAPEDVAEEVRAGDTTLILDVRSEPERL